MVRENYVAFWANDEELNIIDSYAKKFGKTRAKYIRDRAIRPDSTNNEIADLLMQFISTRLEELKFISISAIPETTHDTTMDFKPKRMFKSVELDPTEAGLAQEMKDKLRALAKKKAMYRNELQQELVAFLEKRREKMEEENENE